MTDQNQTPDPSTPEQEPELEVAFQTLEEDWEYNPFAVQVMMTYGHRNYPMWVQASSRADLDALQSRDPEHYGDNYRVAVRNNPFGVKPGVVVQVTHRGTEGVHIDRDWLKAVAYADPNQDHNNVFPELDLKPEVVNEVKGEMNANDGKLATREFLKDYFGA